MSNTELKGRGKSFGLQQRPRCERRLSIEALECCATLKTWLRSVLLFQRTKSLVAGKFNEKNL